MLEGFAGGIQPWWHHVGAYHEDRRSTDGRAGDALARGQRGVPGEPPAGRHRGRGLVAAATPISTAATTPSELVELPYRGMTQALIRARIPYVPVHADHIDRDAAQPDGADPAQRGGHVGRAVRRGPPLRRARRRRWSPPASTSLYDEWGDARRLRARGPVRRARRPARAGRRTRRPRSHHTYLRLTPELRARVWGPKAGDEPALAGQRHAVLRGFDETDILPFGGMLEPLRTDPGVSRSPDLRSAVPGLSARDRLDARAEDQHPRFGAEPARRAGRLLRRRHRPPFRRDNLPDHGNLLANLVPLAGGDIPLAVEGPGLIDCHLYRQPAGSSCTW